MNPKLPKRYSLRSLLGEGGAGRVYRVHDSIRDRELALKTVTSAETAFLRREFDTLRQIRHENLIQVFDWGTLDSGDSYYTMELIEGGDWRHAMKDGPQSADEVRRIVTGVLRGLAHLHCHDEIHGDLKPENILLGAGGVVKITDVGMGGSAGYGSSSGTPGYAAPELWERAKADVRSDLYSVGIMAYEALTGKHPFAGRTVREVVSGQLEGWVPSPGAHGVTVPADLERVVMRAVERQPSLRQGSADEFMEGMGVEDRIGEILGGKLVGREKEIAEIEALLYSEEPGKPTLLRITGEPGIGKTALIEEVSQRVISRGVRVLSPRAGESDPIELILDEMGVSAERDHQLASAAELIDRRATAGPILIVLDLASDAPNRFESIGHLARYLWAMSKESGRSSKSLIVLTDTSRSAAAPEHEKVIQLEPFKDRDLRSLVQGLVGRTELESLLMRRLHALTGGNPGSVRAAIARLAEEQILDRRLGSWRFRESERIQSLQVKELTNHWSIAWGHLGQADQAVLAALALMPAGVPPLTLESGILPDANGSLAGLAAKGWIRLAPSKVTVSSESARHAILASTPLEQRTSIASLLLDGPRVIDDREQRTDLSLAYRPRRTQKEDVVWSAAAAADRGDHRLAVKRLRQFLEVFERDKHSSDPEIRYRLAYSLHRLGEHEEAMRSMGPDGGTSESTPAHTYLRGEIERALGRVGQARERFRESVHLANQKGMRDVEMRSRAAIAELDWQHGDETERESAIALMRSVVAELADTPAASEAVATASYQLGAGLIVAGRFAEANEILSRTLERGVSQFWRMRLANALASGEFYLGNFEKALKWLDIAWEIAEKSGFDAFKARILTNRGGALNGLGRPRDAVDQDLLAAKWARRSGDLYEYSFACVGAAFNLALQARYEEALVQADESLDAAKRVDDTKEIAKATELKALVLYMIGDYDSASRLIQSANQLISGHGYISVGPRLDWLGGRIALARGELSAAEELLARAESVLVSTQDWEDLPGVQIERQILESRLGRHEAALKTIRSILNDSGRPPALAVEVHGAVAIAEILLEGQLDHVPFRGALSASLGRAELAGMLEPSWYLSYALGEFTARDGDKRTSQVRFGHAVRALRQILNMLQPEHREFYLATSHARSAMTRLVPS